MPAPLSPTCTAEAHFTPSLLPCNSLCAHMESTYKVSTGRVELYHSTRAQAASKASQMVCMHTCSPVNELSVT